MRDRSGLATDDDDAVAQVDRFVDVVGDQQHAEAMFAGQAQQQVLQLDAGEGIHRAEGFVEQQHARLPVQPACQRHALRLAAGQLFGQRGCVIQQADLGQQLLHARRLPRGRRR